MGTANRLIARYRGWEFWNTYVFEFPLYLLIGGKLLIYRLGIKDLSKANWSLDHGGFAFASKYRIQILFDQRFFPKTELIYSSEDRNLQIEKIKKLQLNCSSPYPLILKPDNGRIGKGVVKVNNPEQLQRVLEVFEGDYLVQEYCYQPIEVGVFIYRTRGHTGIFSMNLKEFPKVIGDGILTIAALIAKDARLRRFDGILSEQMDLAYIPSLGEEVLLSYVGNHSQGAIFHSLTIPDDVPILRTIKEIIAPCEGFNYGRLDVRAESLEEFKKGNFIVIEVNGIDSLSTNIFDPRWSIVDAYRQLYRQYSLMVRLAAENRGRTIKLFSWGEIVSRTIHSEKLLARNHARILTLKLR